MESRNVRRTIIGIIVGLVTWALVILLSPQGFIGSMQEITSIEQAVITMTLNEDGTLDVVEQITYRFKKPFRGVLREIPADDIGSRYANLQVRSDSMRIYQVEDLGTDRHMNVRVWLVPYQSAAVQPEEGRDRVTVTFSYQVFGAVQAGVDVAQLFRKVWGEDTESWVGEIRANVNFPPGMDLLDFYTHPPIEVEQNGNSLSFSISNHPPKTFAEFRAVLSLSSVAGMDSSNVRRGSFTKEEIDRIEQTTSTMVLLGKWVFPPVLLISVIFLPLLIFKRLGKEYEINYQAEYERDPPTEDPPDLVNCIVKNLTSWIDNDGIGAAMMNLYRLGYIDFRVDSKNDRVTSIIIMDKEPGELAQTEATLLAFMKRQSIDNVFDFAEIKKTVSKSQSKARAYTAAFRGYKSLVQTTASKRHLLEGKGNGLAKLVSFLLLTGSLLLIFLFYPQPEVSSLLPFAMVYAGGVWVAAMAIMFQRRDVFGRWTKEGREYYLKWSNFRRFMSDYSLLNEHPPSSVVLWEKYLVYATALGIADQVRKHLNKMMPKDAWEQQGGHRYMYTPAALYAASSFSSVSASASSHSSSSSGGGAGRAGGGGGGGRTGGF